jgi:hypothetical protein
MVDYRFVVSDEEGELRRFSTRVDAKAFMEGRPELSLKVLPPRRKTRLTYDEMINTVGECLI